MRYALAVLGTVLASLAAVSGATEARDVVVLGYTASDGYVPAMVAKDRGLFEKRGLDVDLQIMALNSAMPAALSAGTVQIAGTTSPVFLQAVDRGNDLVAIAGGSVAEKTNTRFAAVARNGVAIARPQDFIGKTVGAPGLGANTHVLFRNWLLAKGVHYGRVNFVEIPFPKMPEALKGETVDAVVTNDPALYQLVHADIGKVAATFMEVLHVQIPIVVYSATREWAAKHRTVIVAFRESIIEANAMIEADPEVAREAEKKYLALPADIIASVPIPRYRAPITDAMFQNWVDIMVRQQMLTRKPDISKLVLR